MLYFTGATFNNEERNALIGAETRRFLLNLKQDSRILCERPKY